MTFQKCLLLYKQSAYRIYFLDKKSSLFNQQKKFSKKDIQQFIQSHQEHYRSLQVVEDELRKHGVRFRKHARGYKIDYSSYDFVVTVGGDGTFLEAARHLTQQPILGVNSDALTSVGRFCGATRHNFREVLLKILDNKISSSLVSRMNLKLKAYQTEYNVNALNDILMSHKNPAALSRYTLTIDRQTEEQRSSGIWLATPAGSTGAIHSAGGKILSLSENKIQYQPRELYKGKGVHYQLTGGKVDPVNKITITSLMRSGMVFVDGAHLAFPFSFGQKALISLSTNPLRIFGIKPS